MMKNDKIIPVSPEELVYHPIPDKEDEEEKDETEFVFDGDDFLLAIKHLIENFEKMNEQQTEEKWNNKLFKFYFR